MKVTRRDCQLAPRLSTLCVFLRLQFFECSMTRSCLLIYSLQVNGERFRVEPKTHSLPFNGKIFYFSGEVQKGIFAMTPEHFAIDHEVLSHKKDEL